MDDNWFVGWLFVRGGALNPDLISLFTALSNFGALGILVGFFIFKDIRSESARNKLESDHHLERIKLDERRLAYDQARLEADKALSASLAALTSAIQSGRMR